MQHWMNYTVYSKLKATEGNKTHGRWYICKVYRNICNGVNECTEGMRVRAGWMQIMDDRT